MSAVEVEFHDCDHKYMVPVLSLKDVDRRHVEDWPECPVAQRLKP